MIYLDSSALFKLLVREEGSSELRELVGGVHRRCASELVLAELPRALRRRYAEAPGPVLAGRLRAVPEVVAGFDLRRLSRVVVSAAGRLQEPRLRSLDALHLATALALPGGVEAFVTYDLRQLEAATAAGLPATSPGVG